MKKPTFFPKKNQGFALIATILLMVLLAIITIGTLSLSVVTLRSNGQDSAQNIARANARMSLMIAIGELQRHTGSDTRITAPANIVDENYPQVMGVWKSWEGTNHEVIGRPRVPLYSTKDVTQSPSGTGRFVDWLVSTAATKTTPNISDAPTLVQTSAGADTIPLLAEGSLRSTDTRQIHVVPTTLNDDGDDIDDGRFAWWISGENQKARLGQPFQPRNNSTSGMAEMGQSHSITDPEIFGAPSIIANPEPYDPTTDATRPGRKAISRQSLALLEENNSTEPQKKFHDLSAYSSGLLTNTATGGWRKDLSILTERWNNIYNTYPGRALPLFRLTPNAGATTRVPRPTTNLYDPPQSNLYPWSGYSLILGVNNIRQPNTYHAAAASWQSLQSYATSYKNFTVNTGVVESPFVWDEISSRNTDLTNTQIYNYKHVQRLYPHIARFQWLVYARAEEFPVGRNPRQYGVRLLYVPVFTLWNPYSVGIRYNIPNTPQSALCLGWRRSLPGVIAVARKSAYPVASGVPNNQFYMFNTGNMQYTDDNRNVGEAAYEPCLPQNVAKGYALGFSRGQWRVQIMGGLDMRSFAANIPEDKPLTFKPGEAKVFSPNGNIEQRFGGIGIELREGYNPSNIVGITTNYVQSNLRATDGLWFLLKTDKLTQPYRWRNPGIGCTLSFGIQTGNPYTGGRLHSGVERELHNITTITSENTGNKYWPPNEVDEVGYTAGELASGPWVPIFSINMGPRMTIGTGPGAEQNRPTKGVIQSNPLASISLANPVDNNPLCHPANGTFDMTYHSLSMGSTLTPNLSNSKGFIATGYQSGDGLSRLVLSNIPLRPMASLGELEGWNPRGNNPYPPFQSNLIGNSDANPLIPQETIIPSTLDPAGVQNNLLHDDAYCANHLLFDDWFVSSIAPQPSTFGGSIAKDINAFYGDYLTGYEQLTNRSYKRIHTDCNLSGTEITQRLQATLDSYDGWLKVASRFEVEGMFNVNSTSVEAWKALLGHAKSLQKLAMFGADQIVAADTTKEHVVSRGAILPDGKAGTNPSFSGEFAGASEYAGYRSLTDAQINDLAEKVVEQVRLRGPFLSLSEFVNRQLSSNDDLAIAGAIQTAINNLENDPMAILRDPANSLSDKTMLPSDPKLTGVNYAFPEAAVGSSAYGAPGWIRQADILRPIAPILSVRDDTFTIRAYGDALDKNGKVVAQAWCEATVKRTRDFCDPSDAADSIDPPINPRNITFGRKFEIISFRWLNSDEV